LAGADFAEMEHADSCCGLGGTFSVYHYGTSMAINSSKSASIARSGADIVLTGCPGCMMQISDGLMREGIRKKVRHILEILSE
jgi:glycolate oxidase iron-sulfur subunit